jgi:hypothetical protein
VGIDLLLNRSAFKTRSILIEVEIAVEATDAFSLFRRRFPSIRSGERSTGQTITRVKCVPKGVYNPANGV